MLNVHRILFPTDFSECAEHAFAEAADLADRFSAELDVLYVNTAPSRQDHGPLEYFPLSDAALDEALRRETGDGGGTEKIVDRRENEGVKVVQVDIADRSAADAIVLYAESHDIDLVVMGTHGYEGLSRLYHGSTAEEVVREAPCPVLTVQANADADPRRSSQRILVPVDFSSYAQQAIRYAAALARLLKADLELLHVIQNTTLPATAYGIEPVVVTIPDVKERCEASLREQVAELEAAGIPARSSVLFGDPEQEISNHASQIDASLIVISTHGLSGFKRFLLGSVTEKVVRRARCPVFTVKSFGKTLIPSEAAPASGARTA